MSGHRLESSERRMTPVFVPYRGPIAGLRMRNGEVIHRYGTTRDMRAITHKPIPPATIPDWGLEPAASSWIRLRLPLHPREEPPRPPRPSEEREPSRRRVFEGVDGIVAVFYSSFRHLMLVDFVTRKAAHKFSPPLMMLHTVKLAVTWQDFWSSAEELPSKACILLQRQVCSVTGREELSPWAKHGTSLCIEGFDSTLHVDEISSMLARHFGSTSEGIIIPTSLAGSCIGKAYIKCGSWCYFSEALNLDGSNLGGHTLRVNECPGGSKFWHGHITPNGPVTGKRTVFNDDSDNE
ncbi:unnamed protein product [Urochloa decumbens]|uniref:Uncharacterized protein n=1 Tax=Urochloa decumbens TaxID=240449 RepID=A0ABC9FG02_9POAL